MTDEDRARERWAALEPRFPYPKDLAPIDVYAMLLEDALLREEFAEDRNAVLKNQIRDLENALIEATLTIKKVKGL